MWLYFGPLVARNVFGAPDENSALYTEGVEWAGLCIGMYSAVCFVFLVRAALARGAHRPEGRPCCVPGLRRIWGFFRSP
jgi:maltose/moltooligosaccharide transporter